jgi:hypothetical protein
MIDMIFSSLNFDFFPEYPADQGAQREGCAVPQCDERQGVSRLIDHAAAAPSVRAGYKSRDCASEREAGGYPLRSAHPRARKHIYPVWSTIAHGRCRGLPLMMDTGKSARCAPRHS